MQETQNKRQTCIWLVPYSLCLLLGMAHGQVDPATIVQDINKDCPVPNVLYTQEEFTVDRLFSLLTPLVAQGSNNSPCAREVPNLASCASDGSLQVKQGCCSKDCAEKMKQAVVTAGRGCYREFIQVMCNGTEIRQGVSPVLFNAARRCLGLHPACDLLAQPGTLLPPAFEAMVFDSSNATSNATSGTNATSSMGVGNNNSSTNATGDGRSRVGDSIGSVRAVGAVQDTGMRRRALRSIM